MADMPSPPPHAALSTASNGPRWRGWVVVLLLLAALAGGSYWLVQRQAGGGQGAQAGPAGPAADRPPPGAAPGPGGATVGTAQAVHGRLPVLVNALGTVTPPVVAQLTPQVSGQLTELLFAEGQWVQKGQVLARIDARSYQQTLAQAKGQRARDEAQLAVARQTLQRYQTLWQQDSIARQEVDTQAALVRQLQGTVDAGRASERAAQLNVDFSTLRAPISGRIGLRSVDVGNLVSSSTSIASIAQTSPIDVVFALPQERIAQVLAAQQQGVALPVAALDSSRAHTLAQGRFATLDNAVDTATGTVKAKARFDNADGALFPNQFVNVRLQLGEQEGVLVPVTAVRTGPQGDYVYVVDADQLAHMRAVRRGMATVDQVLIAEGLQPGERVVTEGGDRVKDGGRVQLAGAAPPATGASRPEGAGRQNRGERPERRGPRSAEGAPPPAASAAPAAASAAASTPALR